MAPLKLNGPSATSVESTLNLLRNSPDAFGSLPFEVQIPRWFFWMQNKWNFCFDFGFLFFYFYFIFLRNLSVC